MGGLQRHAMYCEASHYLQIIKGGDGQMTQDDSARNHETIFPPKIRRFLKMVLQEYSRTQGEDFVMRWI